MALALALALALARTDKRLFSDFLNMENEDSYQTITESPLGFSVFTMKRILNSIY